MGLNYKEDLFDIKAIFIIKMVETWQNRLSVAEENAQTSLTTLEN